MIEQPAGDADSLKAQAEIIVWWQKQCAVLTKERDDLKTKLAASEVWADERHKVTCMQGQTMRQMEIETAEIRKELAAFKKEHAECLPRVCVEDLLDSTLPCGHPDRCGYSHDKEGRKLGCRWCDDKRNARVESDRLRAALEWYAVKRRYWKITGVENDQGSEMFEDRGERARQALTPAPDHAGREGE